ncbi:vacuolar ATPase assembly integral membrane protein VMA21 [Sphaerosporella brunnea]|uniref:Vacuolar ATPase assembly integral membrane protein VMA21 n=1 Tax=Sphaerosporella brunnea TaxID=1250544 RepID=A0A5J5ELU2_9PEZI|nr:vacuolar ATPase assembly integral membrane protein VMA21 [Sphaerosporella brunnea]
MATRRNVKDEPDTTEPEGIEEKKPEQVNLSVPPSILAKLLFFTFAMLGAPLGTYYISNAFLFTGNSTVAAALAAVMANVILAAYVIVAMREDMPAKEEDERKEKKSQ